MVLSKGAAKAWLVIASVATSSTAHAAVAAGDRTANDEGILALIGAADPIVQAVMIMLGIASIATWALWYVKAAELRRAGNDLQADIATILGAESITAPGEVRYPATREMLDVAGLELKRADATGERRAMTGVEERVAAQLPLVEGRAMYRMMWGTNILASIGSIAPFVGLAGTVWGIMNSFLNISRSESTSLAVVAPGIAEALIATALGLVAAIPAVMIYNILSRTIARYQRQLAEISVLVACIVSREAESREAGAARSHGSRDQIVPISAPKGR